jgi:hypothetical protein
MTQAVTEALERAARAVDGWAMEELRPGTDRDGWERFNRRKAATEKSAAAVLAFLESLRDGDDLLGTEFSYIDHLITEIESGEG